MIQRQCPECRSELVRARRTDQQPAPGMLHAASPGWRCSVCGGEFTTEQLRDSKRVKPTAIQSA
jgi:hypothetical protein